jgi:cation:H+ antiporter
MYLLAFWSVIFFISLYFLIKGADLLAENSEKIGLAFRISPFIIGVTIVAFGTSLPELASSIAAVFKNTTEIVVANVIGSNIANILLIVGCSAVATMSFLSVKRSLIDIDLPLLASVTILFTFIIWDGYIDRPEGILLVLSFVIYLLYTISHREYIDYIVSDEIFFEKIVKNREEMFEVIPLKKTPEKGRKSFKKIDFKVFLFLILGLVFLITGANYLIDSVLKLSEILNIGVSVITIFAVAVGTSLPEIIVSLRTVIQKKYEISLGNILGSNIFNTLIVVGIPSLIKPLLVDNITFKIGFPFMIIATFLLVISGISRRISVWEGSMFIMIYILFLAKIFNWF